MKYQFPPIPSYAKYPYVIRFLSGDSMQHFQRESNLRRAIKTALLLVRENHSTHAIVSYDIKYINGMSLYKPLRMYKRLTSGKIAKCATQNRMAMYI